MDGRRLAIVTIDPSNNFARLVTMPAAGARCRRSYDFRHRCSVGPDVRTHGRHVDARRPVAHCSGRRWSLHSRYATTRMVLASAAHWRCPSQARPAATCQVWKGLPPAGSFTVHPDGKLLAFQLHEARGTDLAIDNLSQFIKAGGGW